MRPQLRITALGAFLSALAVVAPGCGGGPAFEVEVPDRMVLYSIDGREEPGAGGPGSGGETFRGYPVLGKVEVADLKRRSSLVAALNDGIARAGDSAAKCFWPRHAIRAVKGQETTDYVICFECLQLAVHGPSKSEVVIIDRMPLAEFNAELLRAGVPLAPSNFEKAR